MNQASWRTAIQTNQPIVLFQGDITRVDTDIIVNAANSSLLGGGGVDGAIHRAGGKAILDECRKIRSAQGGCATGQAVVTTAGNLPAQYVIHTVGPVWNGDGHQEEALLADCYRNSLRLALEKRAKTIAFPGISTGVYRFPKEKAARIAIREVSTFLEQHPVLEHVVFVVFDEESFRIYQALLP
jgi:O-acetyl-ADP-ribose deacetylase (regulator of RNase III)